MAIEIRRAFNGSDAYMFETSFTLHKIFVENISDFNAFDAKFDAAFATSWLNKINAAISFERDSMLKDVQVQKTLEVMDKMELCKQKYAEVKYFAIKTFPNSKAIQAEFGTEKYLSCRRSPSSMVSFMDQMYKVCLDYQAELGANGMSLAQITEINTLGIELMNVNTIQEGFKKSRPVQTEERITVLNACYADTIRVIRAAQLVYYNDFARRNQFVYYPNRKPKKDKTKEPQPMDKEAVLTPVFVTNGDSQWNAFSNEGKEGENDLVQKDDKDEDFGGDGG
jgi:hypothetical protein